MPEIITRPVNLTNPPPTAHTATGSSPLNATVSANRGIRPSPTAQSRVSNFFGNLFGRNTTAQRPAAASIAGSQTAKAQTHQFQKTYVEEIAKQLVKSYPDTAGKRLESLQKFRSEPSVPLSTFCHQSSGPTRGVATNLKGHEKLSNSMDGLTTYTESQKNLCRFTNDVAQLASKTSYQQFCEKNELPDHPGGKEIGNQLTVNALGRGDSKFDSAIDQVDPNVFCDFVGSVTGLSLELNKLSGDILNQNPAMSGNITDNVAVSTVLQTLQELGADMSQLKLSSYIQI